MTPDQTPNDVSPQCKFRQFVTLLAHRAAREFIASLGTGTATASWCEPGTGAR